MLIFMPPLLLFTTDVKSKRRPTSELLPPAFSRPRQRLGVGRRPPQEDAGHPQGRHVGTADLGHRAANGAAFQPVPAQQEQPDWLHAHAAAQEEGRPGGRRAQELEYRHLSCRGRQAFQVSPAGAEGKGWNKCFHFISFFLVNMLFHNVLWSLREFSCSYKMFEH